MPSNYLVSFHPLCSTGHGRQAVKEHGLPPFIDGSCRREPDLKHSRPSISALCRASKFAPRLQEGDRVAYITTRGRFGQEGAPCWRLVALLRVKRRFETHGEAAAWYLGKGLRLPSNCMVPENKPVCLEMTLGPSGHGGCSSRGIIKQWDADYWRRAKEWPIMLVCEKLTVELHEPARIEKEDWRRWNKGRVPGTQNPPEIADAFWDRLAARARRTWRAA
jgi:hypothetical protein